MLELLSLVTGAGWGWLGGLSAGSNVTSLLSLSTTVGLVLAWTLQQPVQLGSVTTAVRDVFLAASVAIAGVLMWRTPRLGLAGLAGALAALAVLGPSVHPWYLTWALPPAAVVLAGRRAVWPLVVGHRGGGEHAPDGRRPRAEPRLLLAPDVGRAGGGRRRGGAVVVQPRISSAYIARTFARARYQHRREAGLAPPVELVADLVERADERDVLHHRERDARRWPRPCCPAR